MKYRELNVAMEGFQKRLYRKMLIRDDLNLVYVGCILVSSFYGMFEHNFMFTDGKRSYLPRAFEECDLPGEDFMENYRLSDLSDKFIFTYDTGENYRFTCKTKEFKELDNDELAILLDGKGQGIWEDNIGSLIAYFKNEIPADSNAEDPDNGYCLPWNFDNKTYGDFENYNLELEKEIFESSYFCDINDYLDNCHEYGYELSVSPVEYDDDGRIVISNEPWFDDDDDDFFEDIDIDELIERYVQVQIDTYIKVDALVTYFSREYPYENEDEIMDRVSDVLTQQAIEHLDDFDDEDDDFFEFSDDDNYY